MIEFFHVVVISDSPRRAEFFCRERGLHPRRDVLVALAASSGREMEGARIHPAAEVHWLGHWQERPARRMFDALRRNQLKSYATLGMTA